MQLDRRRFLGLLGAAVPLGIAACEAPTGELVAARAGAATDAGAAVGLDAGHADARALADAAVAEDARRARGRGRAARWRCVARRG
jgi:hypothetical protein